MNDVPYNYINIKIEFYKGQYEKSTGVFKKKNPSFFKERFYTLKRGI